MRDLTRYRRRATRDFAVLTVFAVVSGLLVEGCRRREDTSPDVTVRCDVAPTPPTVGAATLIVTLAGPGREPIIGATVRLEGNMSHPGMEPVFASAKEIRPGSYSAPFEFTMAGDWVVTVDATLPGGGRIQKQVDIKGVRGG